MVRSIIILLSIFLVLPRLEANSKYQLSSSEKFSRCYLRLVKRPLKLNTSTLGASLYKQVKAGSKTPVNACMELLDSARLNANGLLTNPNSAEARLILENFHVFHNTFFKVNALNFSDLYNDSTLLVKDLDEPSLYYTRSLFAGLPLKLAVTDNKTLRSVRESSLTNTNYISRVVDGPHTGSFPESLKNTPILSEYEYDSSKYAANEAEARALLEAAYADELKQVTEANNQVGIDRVNGFINGSVTSYRYIASVPLSDDHIVGHGPMIGIKDREPLMVGLMPLFYGATYGTQKVDTTPQVNHNLFGHYGGGILGTHMYLLKNTNLGLEMPTGGRTNDPWGVTPRRFTSRIYEDLLCHVLPTLTSADTLSDLQPDGAHGFLQSTSCMRCHSSFDPLAGVYRGMVVSRTQNSLAGVKQSIPARMKGNPILTVSHFQAEPPLKADAPYALRGTEGRLYYRDHSGKLVKRQLDNVADLGAAIAESDDFYRCVAKRYYNYLTGIEVDLYASESSLNPVQKHHKNFVYQMGRVLKGEEYATQAEQTEFSKHKQSLRSLIELIIESEVFGRRDFGLNGGLREQK